jgi:hypothetical protein
MSSSLGSNFFGGSGGGGGTVITGAGASACGATAITAGGGGGDSVCTGSGLISFIGAGSGLEIFFGSGLIGSGFACSKGAGGSGISTGSGGLGCIISTVNWSGIFLATSNLKFGITTANKMCSKIEQTIAQISVLSLRELFLIAMSKMFDILC